MTTGLSLETTSTRQLASNGIGASGVLVEHCGIPAQAKVGDFSLLTLDEVLTLPWERVELDAFAFLVEESKMGGPGAFHHSAVRGLCRTPSDRRRYGLGEHRPHSDELCTWFGQSTPTAMLSAQCGHLRTGRETGSEAVRARVATAMRPNRPTGSRCPN